MISFLAMWTAMMVPMMLPSLVPVLRRCSRPAVVGVAYFAVWTVVGIAVYPLVAALEKIAMPIVTGVLVVIAGLLQFTAWKAHHLACFRDASGPGTAWRRGVRLGLHCGMSCGNLMAIPLVMGTMDLRVMAAVTAAITCERLVPRKSVVHVIGVLVIAAGFVLAGRTLECGHTCSGNPSSCFVSSSPRVHSHSIPAAR